MEYTTLAPTGLDVSQVALGTWRFGRETNGTVETSRSEAHALLDAAWDRGVNFVDTANIYGDPVGTAERWIGEWLADHDREDVVIASKVNNAMGDGPNESGLGRKHVRHQIEETLDRLGTDYVDVYYMHRWDESTPIEETLRTLDALVAEGKIHYIGMSSTRGWKIAKSLWASDVNDWESVSVLQPRFNAAYRAQPLGYLWYGDEPLDLSLPGELDLAVCPYSPLEGGFLTGKYERGGTPPTDSRGDNESWDDHFLDRQWRVLDVVREVADEIDATPAQVSLRWLIEQREFTCVPVLGSRTVDQLEENLGAVDISLSADRFDRIDEAYHVAE
ncbi:aldo/keto reductase [Halomontanus rarus]|uniref:aldo/keto reductase n=1 Tax=Halomontanus rarus TaxID=3034020 RepID=UPI0023E86AAB|nr:aldo/keto reductase [Halovivax sp. TS33]